MVLNAAVCDRARMARDARFDGRFFIAVLSTGIYCRPICPSPHARRENVRYFGTAADAVAAGFRACLRCRPEAAPGTPRWNGTASTVSRALRLIEEGALQEESLEQLAQRLGVSARQLHRLFWLHLGASPIAMAKAWRLNFVMRLLRETEMPMGRVALAAGFRTVRRFNDAVRARYGRTPSELRRRPDPLDAERDGYAVRLPYRAPFDWDSLLAFLAPRAIPGVEEIASGIYRRTFSHQDRHGVLEVRHDPPGRALEVRVRIAEPVALLPILSRVRVMFDLEADTSAIARHLQSDPRLDPLVRRYPGLRVPGAWDFFEMSVRGAFGESIARPAGPGLGRFARRFGSTLSVPDAGGLTRVFPSAETIATARLEGLPPDSARTLRSLARSAFSESDASAYVALRTLRQPDAFPADDPILRDVAGSERWSPWRAYAALYLWRARRSGTASSHSTSLRSRASASSHCFEIRSRSRPARERRSA
jgi:AraC family transcriptional regulator of adaptative response / DNA-3-methyladenine glycosylase II